MKSHKKILVYITIFFFVSLFIFSVLSSLSAQITCRRHKVRVTVRVVYRKVKFGVLDETSYLYNRDKIPFLKFRDSLID